MEIKIIKKNIYDYAMALTARAGAASDAYSQIAITRDNYPMLDVYLSEAILQAEGSLRKKLSNSNNFNMLIESDHVTIHTKEQDMAEKAVYNLVESSIRLYIAYHIAASWLQVSPASSLADTYGTTAAIHLQAALSALNQKKTVEIADNEYKDRSNDCIFARPGKLTTNDEVLVIRSEKGEGMQPAITITDECLISNQ